VVAHIDIYNFKENIPVEMKGVRKDDIKEPKSFHVQQLKYYMAMTGAHKGIVFYQLLLHYKDKPFKEFVVTMTDEELKVEREKLLSEAKRFSDAILQAEPMLASNVWDNKELNYQCRSCNYFTQCREWQLQE
jgi:CRISPR/Cas system-associated exonuclease Cas4 (RecB family)